MARPTWAAMIVNMAISNEKTGSQIKAQNLDEQDWTSCAVRPIKGAVISLGSSGSTL